MLFYCKKNLFNVGTNVSSTKINILFVKIDSSSVDIDDFGIDVIVADVAKGIYVAGVLSIKIRGLGIVLFSSDTKRNILVYI